MATTAKKAKPVASAKKPIPQSKPLVKPTAAKATVKLGKKPVAKSEPKANITVKLVPKAATKPAVKLGKKAPAKAPKLKVTSADTASVSKLLDAAIKHEQAEEAKRTPAPVLAPVVTTHAYDKAAIAPWEDEPRNNDNKPISSLSKPTGVKDTNPNPPAFPKESPAKQSSMSMSELRDSLSRQQVTLPAFFR